MFSDALSVLQALKNSRCKEQNHLTSALVALGARVEKVVIQWIPAHCGIRGNEKADILAKDGAQKEQANNLVSYDEIKTIIKAQQGIKWRLQHPKHNSEDEYHLLGRREQVKIFRLRTGHNRLLHHMHTKFGIGQSGECPCGEGPMTTDHILQECMVHAASRRKYWPTPTAVEAKLYGTLEELRWTAAFIEDTGLLI